jgi:hypothetical protein
VLLASAERIGSTWYDMLPGLITVGVGMGVTFAPPVAMAMSDVPPAMTGIASGFFNIARLSGSLIGSASVGALLQARLVPALTASATHVAAGLSAAARARFINGFATASTGNLQAQHFVVPGAPAQAAAQVLHEGLADAIRWTYALPVVVLLVGAIAVLGVKIVAKPAAKPEQLIPVSQAR